MNDLEKLRAQHRQLIIDIATEAGLKPSALAKAIGKPPSTLNKMFNDKHKHALSSPTIAALEAFRGRLGLPRSDGSVEVDTEVVRNLLKSPEDRALIAIWTRMEEKTKIVALDILDAVTRIAPKKIGEL